MDIIQENENIFRITTPYKDIFTTVYLIKTKKGALLFDCASYGTDVDNYIIRFLNEIGVNDIKYVFISHNHTDHAGGLKAFMTRFSDVCIVTRSKALKESFSDYKVLLSNDGDTLLDVLKVVTIPGHTADAQGILDTRTNTLISGDCLQMYGIYGSGAWGANITLPKRHFDALDKLEKMQIENLLTAHDYHPKGYKYVGKNEVAFAINACREPLLKVEEIIKNNTALTDVEIAEKYNELKLPRLSERVVAAVREYINKGD